jgi:hypothetical protein
LQGSVSSIDLLFSGCGIPTVSGVGAEPPPKIEAHRLGRSEILNWLQAGFGTGKPIEFRSHEGRGCCDMGDTSLVFRPDQTIYILRDGYAGTEFTLPYRILEDGKITVEPTDNKLQANYLLSEDIHDFYVFRYGSITGPSSSCKAKIPLTNQCLRIANGNNRPV